MTGLSRGTAAAFLVPALALIAVFLIVPALWTLALGATDLRLTGAAAANPTYVGLAHVRAALGDPLFFNALRVTAVFVAGSALIGQALLGFALAWLLRAWRGWTRRAVELLVVLAWIVPASVVSFLWIALLDGESGTLNALLPGRTEWLLDYPLASIIVFNTWRGAAFAMLLFGAALETIPPSWWESARVAGASLGSQLRDVVLPAIRGHIATGLLLLGLWTFNTFTPFLLTRGGPNFQTETLPIYVYRTAFASGRLGYGAALSAMMLAINLLLVLVYLRLRPAASRR